MYIVLVPILGIFLKRRAGIKVWISVFLAVAGLYLLCMTEKLSLGKGDALVLLCALVFAIHILVIDHFSPKVDGGKAFLHPVSGLRRVVRHSHVSL